MKTIKQIQEENRKIIILANNPDAKLSNGIYYEAEREDGSEYHLKIIMPLTLSRVLIAIDFPKYRICKNKDKLVFRLDTGFLGQDVVIEWDLTKETLELQTEEVQRAINKLLTNK